MFRHDALSYARRQQSQHAEKKPLAPAAPANLRMTFLLLTGLLAVGAAVPAETLAVPKSDLTTGPLFCQPVPGAGGLVYETCWACERNADGTTRRCGEYLCGPDGECEALMSDANPNVPLWAERFVPTAHAKLSGDFDGDGLTDIVALGGDSPGALVARSTGDRFDEPEVWSTSPLCAATNSRWLAGDFNGDGRHDLLVVGSNGVGSVALSSGASFASPATWATGINLNRYELHAADMNGDGADDLVFVGTPNYSSTSGDVSVAFSARNTFRRSVPWADAFCSTARCRFGDVNGDGLDDMVAIRSGLVSYRVSAATGPTGARRRIHNDGYDDARAVTLADIDGNGTDELIGFFADRSVRYSPVRSVASPITSHLLCQNQEGCDIVDADGDRAADALDFVEAAEATRLLGDVFVSH